MIRTILFHGAIGALIVGVFLAAGIFWPNEKPPTLGLVIGYTAQLLALSMVFIGVKSYRDKEKGGVIKFFPALGVGLAISEVASIGWAAGWEVFIAGSHFDYTTMMMQMMTEEAQKQGASPDQATAQAQAFIEMYKNPLVRFPMTFVEMFPVGVLVSLVSAGLLRNSRFLPARSTAT